jgi:hypothetical protein
VAAAAPRTRRPHIPLPLGFLPVRWRGGAECGGRQSGTRGAGGGIEGASRRRRRRRWPAAAPRSQGTSRAGDSYPDSCVVMLAFDRRREIERGTHTRASRPGRQRQGTHYHQACFVWDCSVAAGAVRFFWWFWGGGGRPCVSARFGLRSANCFGRLGRVRHSSLPCRCASASGPAYGTGVRMGVSMTWMVCDDGSLFTSSLRYSSTLRFLCGRPGDICSRIRGGT